MNIEAIAQFFEENPAVAKRFAAQYGGSGQAIPQETPQQGTPSGIKAGEPKHAPGTWINKPAPGSGIRPIGYALYASQVDNIRIRKDLASKYHTDEPTIREWITEGRIQVIQD